MALQDDSAMLRSPVPDFCMMNLPRYPNIVAILILGTFFSPGKFFFRNFEVLHLETLKEDILQLEEALCSRWELEV